MTEEADGLDDLRQDAQTAEEQFRNLITALIATGDAQVNKSEHRQDELVRALSDLAGDEVELHEVAGSSLDLNSRFYLYHYMEILLEAAFIVGSHARGAIDLKSARKAAGALGGRSSAATRIKLRDEWQSVARSLAIRLEAESHDRLVEAIADHWPEEAKRSDGELPVKFETLSKYVRSLAKAGVIGKQSRPKTH